MTYLHIQYSVGTILLVFMKLSFLRIDDDNIFRLQVTSAKHLQSGWDNGIFTRKEIKVCRTYTTFTFPCWIGLAFEVDSLSISFSNTHYTERIFHGEKEKKREREKPLFPCIWNSSALKDRQYQTIFPSFRISFNSRFALHTRFNRIK